MYTENTVNEVSLAIRPGIRRSSSSKSSTADTSRPSSNNVATSSWSWGRAAVSDMWSINDLTRSALSQGVKPNCIIPVPMEPPPLTLPLEYAAIEKILPHRYPFLLVDRITELEMDKRIVGLKNISSNEP